MEKIVSDFIKFETINNVFVKNIYNLKFWSYVRFSIFWSFYSDEYFDGREFSKSKLIRKYIFGLFKGLLNIIMLSGNKYDFLFINTSRRTNIIDNNNVDIYTYPVIKTLSKKYKILLLDISKFDNSNEYPCDFLAMRFTFIFNKVFSFLYRFSKKDKDYLCALEV